MEEIWRVIPETNEKYAISNLANCVRLCDGKVMNKNNSLRYSRYSINGKYESVHKLVALSFLDNENNYKCVYHIDGDAHNNKPNNLKWCENYAKEKFGTIGTKVKMLNESGDLLMDFSNAKQASIYLNKNSSGIRLCLCGKRKNAYGYKWIRE